MSEVAKWVVVTLLSLGVLATVVAVGKPRRPLTGSDAAFVVLFNGLLIAAILTWWST